MRQFRDWSIRSKLAFIVIVPVLLSVAMLCISFMNGYLDLKNRALPSQKIALMIADKTTSYLSSLRRYVDRTDSDTLETLRQTDKNLQQYMLQYEEIIGKEVTPNPQFSRQIITDINAMLNAGRKVVQLSDARGVVIENSEAYEEALITLLSSLTDEINREAEQVLAAKDIRRLDAEILPTLNIIAELSALGHSLLSETREFMLQPNEQTRREMIELEVGLRQAYRQLADTAPRRDDGTSNTTTEIENTIENLIAHAERAARQRIDTQELLNYLVEKEDALGSTLNETVNLVENQALKTQTYLLTAMITTASVCTLLAFFWGVMVAKSISRPIVNLTSAVRDFGADKTVAAPFPDAGDEIGELSKAFKKMMEEIKQASQSLEEAKAYNWNIVQSMQDALFVVNGEGQVERVNQATLALVGDDEGRIIGKPLADFLTISGAHREEDSSLHPVIRELVAGDIVENIECTVITRENQKIPALLSGAILHDNNTEIKRVVCVIHDMSEHVRAERLAEARDRAEAANQAKTTFLSRMSHELRTPMNAILGFAQLQEKKFTAATPEHARRINRQILSAGWHLLNLINDLLDLVQIEGNALKLSLETCDLQTAIDESLNLVLAQNIKPGVTVNYESVPMAVTADYTRLKQVLINLLSNAIKYNRDQGSVTIHTRAVENGQVEISVSDTGVGFTPEAERIIFEPFTRLPYAEENEIQGTGIGLSLTKYLVERMGGNIRVDSHIGHGTVFLVRLNRGASTTDEVQTQRSAPTQLPPRRTDKLTVLYVEDNPHSTELMEAVAAATPGIELLTSATAEEGIELAKHFQPRLILLDINLPSMDGITTVGILRRDPAFKHTRILALSADAMPAQIEEAMRAGFDQYITKPINIEQIIGIFSELGDARTKHVS